MFDPIQIKKDFPIFKKHPELIYLDSGASSLKPEQVIAKEDEYYREYSANIFRGIYKISEQATGEYEAVRSKVAAFIGAADAREIIFVRNTTEALNLVMYSWGRKFIQKDAEIAVTIMEHHANFVPWQQLVLETNSTLKVVDITEDGLLNISDLEKKITKNTQIFAVTHVSNVLGTINPLKDIIRKVRQINPTCIIVVDGAQAAPHLSLDVNDLGADFYAFSSHKMLGPTGVGVLWGKYELLDQMNPYQYGGEMIEAVYVDHSLFKEPPHKFEAGTPHIAGVIGLGAAIDYLQNLGRENLRAHEQELVAYGIKKLQEIEGITIIGSTDPTIRGGVLTFTLKKAHAHDIAQILDSNNICIRSGHHCAMPLHIRLNVSSTARASFHAFTTHADIDALITGITQVQKIFS